jgi:hypothetical protein
MKRSVRTLASVCKKAHTSDYEKGSTTMKLLTLFCLIGGLAVSLSAGPSICDGTAGNLVANCGFETGDFTAWTLTGNTGFTGVTGGGYANSGNFGAFFGQVGSDGFLSQTLPTVAGTVGVSFYLFSPGGTPNDFTVSWDGVDIGPDLVNSGAFAYTQYAFNLTSLGNDTLRFTFRQDPSFWGLDDVVVAQTPEPGTMGMLFLGLGTVIHAVRRRRA